MLVNSKNHPKTKFKFRSKAFSLLKLSFVILIIAVLVIAILLGKNLVGRSRVTNAQTLVQSPPVMVLSVSEIETVKDSFFANLFVSEANAAVKASELSDVMKYMSKKFNAKILPVGKVCNGVVMDGGCDVTSCSVLLQPLEASLLQDMVVVAVNIIMVTLLLVAAIVVEMVVPMVALAAELLEIRVLALVVLLVE